MSEFKISLKRTHIEHDGDLCEVWYADVENAEGYERGQGEVPGVALRQLAGEFDRLLGNDQRGRR